MEREDEEVQRLVRPSPKSKPPRKDKRREVIQTDEDQDEEKDPDLSLNYKSVGGSIGGLKPYSSYQPQNLRMVASVCLCKNSNCVGCGLGKKLALYHGVEPYPKGNEGFAPYTGWTQAHQRDLGDADYNALLKSARGWLRTPVLANSVDGIVRDTQLRAALDLAIRSHEDGRYSSGFHPAVYDLLLAKLAGVSTEDTLLTVRTAQTDKVSTTITKPTEFPTMTMPKFASAEADNILGRIDRVASMIQDNHEKWGMDFRTAKNLVNELDKVADEIETASFGPESLMHRQAEVIQRESDEKYMETFKNPMAPISTNGDEPYMKAYGDDQSSAVHHGKSTTGRPLAP